jgi:hypothetical protein
MGALLSALAGTFGSEGPSPNEGRSPVIMKGSWWRGKAATSHQTAQPLSQLSHLDGRRSPLNERLLLPDLLLYLSTKVDTSILLVSRTEQLPLNLITLHGA